MNLENAEGKITISRPSGGFIDEGDAYIEIQLHDGSSGVEFASVRVQLAVFAAALTGLGYQPMRFDFKPSCVGLVRETKTELVPVDRHVSRGNRDHVAIDALAPFEVDGWAAHRDDLFNGHKSDGKGNQRVIFVRFVQPDSTTKEG